jgi:hypothetical protein
MGLSRQRVNPLPTHEEAPRLQFPEVSGQGAGRHTGGRLELHSALSLLLESANDLNPPRLRESRGQIEECLDRGGVALERPSQSLD